VTTPAAANKPTAADKIRALGKKPTTPAGQVLPAGMTDPAIVGAKRDKNTVKLGVDPEISERARYCSKLAKVLQEAEADFKVLQGELRDYGRGKRGLYNEHFKANVTTVCVPYSVEVPAEADSATPGRETKFVQVVCTNRYSVEQEIILNHKDTFGDLYPRLFEEKTVKTLKPDAEELIRDLLKEQGMAVEEIDSAMDGLMESKTTVKATEGFEKESREVTDALKEILNQAVTRVQPALKFPDLE
jgi:hypothetical protein